MKMRQLSKIVSLTSRSMNSNVRYGSSVSHYKPSTMNDMPSPSGSWAALNSARQAKYNMHLIVGVAFAVATLAAGYTTGSFYLNLGPELKNK